MSGANQQAVLRDNEHLITWLRALPGMMNRFIIVPLVLSGILVFFGCATDESRFDNSFTNDAFQKIMGEDGVTEDHLTDGAEMAPASHPSGEGHNPPQRRVAPKQPQQGHSSDHTGVGGGWIGNSIPMDPNH